MRLLDAVDEDRRDVEVLLTALQQAVAEVHGLGGMVHLPGGGMSGILYLVADSGLPESMTRPWLIIPARGTAPPSRAVRNDTITWRPDLAPPDPVPGRDPAALWPSRLPPASVTWPSPFRAVAGDAARSPSSSPRATSPVRRSAPF
ncbi:hypothetical protein O1M54_32770 [Streptomyces diastatochromogenes]|nr:hypothetical protein [Streptomyces diastatochromogenes]